ncbi:MAG: glycosyltransferase family 2 protein [Rhodospirillales bacterium]|nr:glycosyltransferase family 2 protein [Alphaproteobacteria bacterium]MBL6928774.1 glycosyltransferase family 2 protein [Rhodospirillales bacterium]
MPTSPAFDDVTVVIVTFNSARTIVECVGTLPNGIRVIVVDNASTDGTCALVEQARPDVEIVRNTVNEGYGFANNQGMALVKTDFGLILNPDTLVDGEALSHLMAAADRNPDAAMIAPLLLRPRGGFELPLMGPWEKNHHQAQTEPDGDFCTWFLTGAALLCNMVAWKHVGGFDEAIFLYNEDADLALRFNALGYSQIVTPLAKVPHVGGGSVPQTLRVRWLKDWHMTWSNYYFEGKYGGDPVARRAQARSSSFKSGLRALLYVLLLNPKKVVGNAAKASAARAYALEKPSTNRRPG